MSRRSGPGVAVLALALLVMVVAPAAAQSPSPSPPASPAPSFVLTDRGEASDDRFLLTIETDATQVTSGDRIDITTMWAHKGAEPIDIATSGGGPVTFVVEQLDGPFDPGGASDDACRLVTVQPRTVEPVPFQKSGGYDASDPMAPRYAAWFDDPVLHLPAGIFRITAHAEHGVGECGTDAALDASVVIEVTAVPGASASPAVSPSPSVAPLALWTPIDLDLIPWEYACFLRFDPSAIAVPRGVHTDDPYLREMVERQGPDAHLLMVDDRYALIGVVTDTSYNSDFPMYQFELEKLDGRWTGGGQGSCRPWAAFAGLPAVGGHWRVDPAFPPPTPRSRIIHALAVYSGCPSAVKVRGKPRVVMTKDAVAAVVPVVNLVNSDACSPGTPTPVAIRLPEPLGDRALYDAGVLPMRRIKVR